ncbi:MAG: dihydrolipoyl dehydrogenase [Desulfobacteraceae bacterium]|nr:MAG: dihydrolipoyl dehydrogenase [Desulfobacteraceae bacterium]
MKNFDVIVIGGGPGGYVAAVRASQLGFKTALVEKENLGGVCLNWGCVPTKSLLQNAEVVHTLSRGRTFGFELGALSTNFAEAHKRSRSVVIRQVRRTQLLMKRYSIEVYEGMGRVKGTNLVEVDPSGEKLGARHIILATGARPRALPGNPFDDETIINYRTAVDMRDVPSSVVVVGGGPIGMEFATLWARYGVKVTVLEMLPRIVPLEDEDISMEAEKQFKRSGIQVYTGARVEEILQEDKGARVRFIAGEKSQELPAEKVLVAIGFAPNSEDLGLERAGVFTTRGYIDIDLQMRTSVPNIYAIGDVTGKLGLAHTASAQGMIAAEAIAGRPTEVLDYSNIPRCTYAYPESASVGLTERQAREQGHEVIVSQAPFAANAKALALDENFGFVKLVGEAAGKKLLGIHLIGPHVTELIAGPAALIRKGAAVEELGCTVHPHPSLSEAIMEAAHAMMGHAIHI